MRRWIAVLMMPVCLLFCSCRKNDDGLQAVLDFRTKLLAANGCAFSCSVEADLGDKIYNFSLNCSYDGEAGMLTVTAPETIAGITAAVRDNAADLDFDGLHLDLGSLAGGRVSPLSVPWLLGSAWSGDYIAAVGTEEDMLRVTILKDYGKNELVIDSWFADSDPCRAEVSYDGTRVLLIEIADFEFLK